MLLSFFGGGGYLLVLFIGLFCSIKPLKMLKMLKKKKSALPVSDIPMWK